MHKNLINEKIISQSDYLKNVITSNHLDLLKNEESLKEYIPSLKKKSAKKDVQKIQKALTDFSNSGIINFNDMPSIEAIIFPELRPVFTIKDDNYNHVQKKEWEILNNPTIKNNLLNAFASIGRIEVPTNSRIPYAGTGFLVSKDIIMTNRHVAELFCNGLGKNGVKFIPDQIAGIDFKEEINTPLEDHVFFDIKDVIMIHPYWDMALLKVTVPERHQDKMPLSLSLMKPEDIKGRQIAVVGYPAFDSRNDGLVQHNLFGGIYNIKRLQPGQINGTKVVRSFHFNVRALAHDASTLGGNSGSAVIDLETGHVLGLHFAGKYMESNYAVPMYELAKDKFVQDIGLNFIGQLSSEDFHWKPVWDLVNREANLDEISSNKTTQVDLQNITNQTENQYLKCKSNITSDGKLSISVPVELSFVSNRDDISIKSSQAKDNVSIDSEEGLIGNYDERKGFDLDFLGEKIQYPWLSDELYLKVERNTHATKSRHILPYTHFSIVMNRERRLPFFSAVNIDGSNLKSLPDNMGGSSGWYFDKRISREAQMGNEYYKDFGGVKNPLDRGHVVRRVEPMWGNDLEVVMAHNDTYHWTNCSTQHTRFNKQGFVWAKIENYMFDNALAEGKKISVFSGAVFRDSDPLYMAPTGAQMHLPIEFWKVLVYINNGALKARAFLLSQEREVKDLTEAFDDGKYKEFQLPIAKLEDLIDLQFANISEGFDLKNFDAFIEDNQNEALLIKQPITKLEDIF